MVDTDLRLAAAALGNTGTGAVPKLFVNIRVDGCKAQCPVENSHADEEVHAVDTNAGVVLDTKIDVLADTESEVTGLREVALAELVLLDLEATLEDLLGLGATDGDVDGDLFVTTDTEGTDGVTGLAVDGGLTGELLEHLGGTSESITGLSNGDVQDQLRQAKGSAGVLGLSNLGGLHCVSLRLWMVYLVKK